MSKFIISRIETELGPSRDRNRKRMYYFAGDSSPFPNGSSDRNRALQFPSRAAAEEELTNKPNRHPFKLGNIEEIETVL